MLGGKSNVKEVHNITGTVWDKKNINMKKKTENFDHMQSLGVVYNTFARILKWERLVTSV